MHENQIEIAETFRQLSETTTWYSDQLRDVGLKALGMWTKDELKTAEDFPEAVGLLSDKEQMITASSASHDYHTSAILAKEDACRDSEDKTSRALLDEVRKAEYERNRHRMHEIEILAERYNNLITEKLEETNSDDERGYEGGY